MYVSIFVLPPLFMLMYHIIRIYVCVFLLKGDSLGSDGGSCRIETDGGGAFSWVLLHRIMITFFVSLLN